MSGPIQAFTLLQSGRQAQRVAQMNASLYEMDAVNAENETITIQQKAEIEKLRLRREVSRVQGDVKVGFAGGGVDLGSGTVMEVLEQNYQMAKMDEDLIQYNANIEKANALNMAARSRFQAGASIQQGKYAKYSSRLKAFGTLLDYGSNKASEAMIT
jgi:hypothetical protein